MRKAKSTKTKAGKACEGGGVMEGDKIIIENIEGIHPFELFQILKNIAEANDYGFDMTLSPPKE